MTVTKFHVPKDHVLEEILRFGSQLACYSGAGREFAFDFQGRGMDTPFGMVFIGTAIREFMKRYPEAKFAPLNYQERGYAAYMGYFQTCGFDIGKGPGQAQGSDTYLPVTILPVSKFLDQAREEIREIGDVIEEDSRKLSTILLQKDHGDAVEMLAYTFREVIRNVAEHSKSDSLVLCAQFRKKMKQAEIAILDTGLGIRSTLSNNPFLQIKDDHEALNLALMPGISGKQFKGVKRDPYDAWQNSGYGLFAVSRLCGHGGKFTICSGDTALSLKPDKKEYHKTNFQGTALRIILSAAEIKNTQSTLMKIMKEGDQLAKELGIVGSQPSTASKMLSMEFRKKE
jgi:hypothetical protein